MLLTLATTHSPATDLGFLLRKNPARAQTFSLSFGAAHVVWPEATPSRAEAALLVDLDPVALVRGRAGSPRGGPLSAYVNDRPYVASSFLSVALGKVFRSALNGSAPERPELVDTPIPLELRVDVVASRGGGGLLQRLFEPLGWAVGAERLPRDPDFPEWGASALHRLHLSGTATVQRALQHLYVLLPVLDDDKHYWVGPDEVEKLLAKAGDWLAEHPERQLVAERYLRHRRSLAAAALRRLDVLDDDDGDGGVPGGAEAELERPLRLNDVRLDRVVQILVDQGVRRVVDLGCGEGKLLARLLKVPQLQEVVGVDVSARALDTAERRLDGPRAPLNWQQRLTLLHGSATYRDHRLDGYDAIVAVEVIEHIDEGRLDAFVASVFGGSRPPLVILTTPNAEHNVRFEGLAAGRMRHPDHRFEWTRAELEAWANQVAEAHGYSVSFEGVGPDDDEVGPPTQLALFRLAQP